ncbi:hypothetical protein [Helicobacter cappadocius]|uniref:Uncharacterized protein n=1 Tax=Helicobacter cappadocius TaxID=3063998 RepID=A0AA90PYQ9_9HELI|nr:MULTISPECIES: hypothetical protein [unclassified Helicobacter]MDO7252998.1 hypothetical protein [Helicobacter sp. faydin-H75]MDP2539013.1 hypothetical protein [Helicobacter sp. faydin-H76]
MKKSISFSNSGKKSQNITEEQSFYSKPNFDVLLDIERMIQECEKILESKDAKAAQSLKAKILVDYEKYYYKAMNESLGKDIICEYDIYGQYHSDVLHIDRCYRLNHEKLFENLYILKTKITSLKKIFDKKPNIFL